jgi:hypothetical protein
MNQFTNEDLKELAQAQEPHCVTLLMPTHRFSAQTQENRIRLKSLLGKAEQRLLARGMRDSHVQRLVEPAQSQLHGRLLRQGQSDGLAIFLDSSGMRLFKVPEALEEVVVVDDRFYVAPFFHLLAKDMKFYVLAVSPMRTRLLSCTRDAVTEVHNSMLPESFDELGRFIDAEKQLQFHTRAAPTQGTGSRAGVYHGQGGGIDDAQRKKYLLEYCRLIDKGVRKALNEKNVPLVLACDDSLRPIYRQANTYPQLVAAAVEGNPDRYSAEELHNLARRLVEPLHDEAGGQAATRYQNASANGHTFERLEEVLPASCHGRIDTLFVKLGERRWGTLDASQQEVVVHESPEPNDQELLNLAAVQTFLKGGTVHVFSADRMPTGSPVAAILRY